MGWGNGQRTTASHQKEKHRNAWTAASGPERVKHHPRSHLCLCLPSSDPSPHLRALPSGLRECPAREKEVVHKNVPERGQDCERFTQGSHVSTLLW